MDIQINIAEDRNIPKVLEMMQAFNAIDDYPFDVEARWHNLIQFLENQELGKIFLIQLKGKTIGYIVLAYGFSFEYKGRDAFIDEFYIDAKFRSMGVGKTALKSVIDEATREGVNAIHLEVESHNVQAGRLYEANNFIENDRKLMTCEL